MDPLDAVIAAPEHHRVLLENEFVRMLDTRIEPGETTKLHTHQWPASHYVLSWSDVVRRDERGNVTLDTRVTPVPREPGEAVWSGPMEPHTLENVGTAAVHIVSVEVKRAGGRGGAASVRLRMRCDLGGETPAAPADEGVRAPREGDLSALAALMLDAYRGTVDDEGGEISEAEEEVRRVFAGVYGPFDAAASEVVVRDGAAVNATLVTEYEGKALVAFSMTAKAWQRRGLARRGLFRTMARLRSAGRKDVWLAVTEGNVPARGLYDSVGFVVG